MKTILITLLFSLNVWAGTAPEMGFVGGSLLLSSKAVLVDTDAPHVIDVTSVGQVFLSSDNPSAPNRDIALTEPGGKRPVFLVLIFDGSGGLRLLDNSPISGGTGFVRLGGNWTMTANRSTLLLIFDGVSDWHQIGGSINN